MHPMKNTQLRDSRRDLTVTFILEVMFAGKKSKPSRNVAKPPETPSNLTKIHRNSPNAFVPESSAGKNKIDKESLQENRKYCTHLRVGFHRDPGHCITREVSQDD